jgi:uncharacterized protein (DUF302 family)
MMADYGYTVEVDADYDEAVIRTRVALRSEGFSILTESHVGGLLGPQSGSDRQYLIMGAWSTGVERSPDPEIRIAMNLPCNVVVQESGPRAMVAALDPFEQIDPTDSDSVRAAESARDALGRAFTKISAGA